jgi:hypothetical protein
MQRPAFDWVQSSPLVAAFNWRTMTAFAFALQAYG